jgi:hypothetical protein
MVESVERRKARRRERDRKRAERARKAHIKTPRVAAIHCMRRVRERGEGRTFARPSALGGWYCVYCGGRMAVVFDAAGHDFADEHERAPP